MFPYIDDYILVMHRDKSVDAVQYLVHLLTEDSKIKAILQECHAILGKNYLSRNKFQSLVGKLIAIIFINRMLSLFRFSHNRRRIQLTSEFFQDLHWFIVYSKF